MSQDNLLIGNGPGLSVRGRIQAALKALGSLQKGPSGPSGSEAGWLWMDDNDPSSTVWTVRISDGTDWSDILRLDTTNNRVEWLGTFPAGAAATPGIAFAGDPNTGFFLAGADELGVAAGGVEKMRFNTGNVLLKATTTTGLADGSADNPGAALSDGVGALVLSIQCNTFPNVTLSKKTGATNLSFIQFLQAGALLGSIVTNGTATLYNTTSDERLKAVQRETAAPEELDAIWAALAPAFVQRLDSPDQQPHWAFLAQRVAAAVPDAVFRGSDAGPAEPGFEPWQVSYAGVVPAMMVLMQGLRAEIADLRARLDGAAAGG